jgi:hypothetical protein
MPLEIVNKELYQDRTVQDWHRRVMPRDADAIDVDLVGVCRHSYCREPLYWIEATTNPNKPATILRRFAQMTNAYGLVVQHDTETLTDVRVVGDPNAGKWSLNRSQDLSGGFAEYLNGIRHIHQHMRHGGA